MHVVPLVRIEWSLLPHDDIDYWTIPFAAYTTAEAPTAFQLARQLPEIAASRGWISTPSNKWFLGLT